MTTPLPYLRNCLWAGAMALLVSTSAVLTGWTSSPSHNPSREIHRLAPGPLVIEVRTERGRAVPRVTVNVGGRFAVTGNDGKLILDGLPAGSYRTTVFHPGFQAWEETVLLPEGTRDPLVIGLIEVAQVRFEGRVTLEGHGGGIAGAHVLMTPLAVEAAVQGRYEFLTSMTGDFMVMEAPPGIYRFEVRAAGCNPFIHEEVLIEGGMPPLAFELSPETVPASLTVRVVDERTGEPVTGAEVILADGYPRGIIAREQTGDDGTVLLSGIQVGLLNWETPISPADLPWDKDLRHASVTAVAPGEATLIVQAEGYARELQPIRLVAESTLTVALASIDLMAPRSDNHTVLRAREITLGAAAQFIISEESPESWYRFRLQHPTLAEFSIDAGAPFRKTLTLLNANGENISSSWNYSQVQVKLSPRWLNRGIYLLQVTSTGRSQDILTLRTAGTPVKDTFDPNHSREDARLIVAGRQVRGYLAPAGDRDYYRFEVRRPSQVRLSLAASPMRKTIELFDAGGDPVTSAWAADLIPVRVETFLEPGLYFAGISSNEGSIGPYSLWLQMIEDDGIDDARQVPGRVVSPRTLTAGSQIASTFYPVNDEDYFRLPIPARGRIHLRSISDIRHELHLLGPQGEPLASGWSHASIPVNVSQNSDGPTTWFVKVKPASHQASTNPYIIQASFEPCDEWDRMMRNDRPEQAMPLFPGQPVRGSIFPLGDVDWYSIEIDHPGYLQVENTVPVRHDLKLFNDQGTELRSASSHAGIAAKVDAHVNPGLYRIRISAINSDSSAQYKLIAHLNRAEPPERVPLNRDPPRQLRLNQAQTWQADRPGDVDTFTFEATAAGRFHLQALGPVSYTIKVSNALTGEVLHDARNIAGAQTRRTLEATGPTRYTIELGGGTNWLLQPGSILIANEPRSAAVVSISSEVNPIDPTEVTFVSKRTIGSVPVQKIELDIGDNGVVDGQLPVEGAHSLRLPAEGLYRAKASIHSQDGLVTEHRFWVDARGISERCGVVLLVDSPSEGEVVDRDMIATARAMSYSGARITRLEALLNGRPLPPSYNTPFQFDVPWRELDASTHTLAITAFDASGESTTVKRNFRVGEYFDLQPEDGAVVTGNQVRVSWTSGGFTPSAVVYRVKGQEHWEHAISESGRHHLVMLPNLETGVTYEFQPLGGKEPGPVRTLTRVNGLAFGRPFYGPTIERDYDQRFAISVRNHAEEPMIVRLTAGVVENDELLVGFVEEGATERPFALDPGEERYFTLSLNAQDAMNESYSFPIRIESENGFTDEALVTAAVHLPVVQLEWENLGPVNPGLGQRYRLINQGDTLTDLSIRPSSRDLSVSPSMEHGLLPAGHSVEITVYPRLYDGFQSVSGYIVATAVKEKVEYPVTLEVPDGQGLYQVSLLPEAGNANLNPDDIALLRARSLAAALITPDYIRPEDWGTGTDTSGNGRLDRWVFIDELERILWVGEDTTGDGEIDFIKGDVGFDGQFNYAAVQGNSWQRTSLLDVYIETSFNHPRDRSSYDPYDVDIVLNGVVVGRLEDTLPEGNHRFRVPPTALKFNAEGNPEGNNLEVRSRRMGRGSYGMSSDFQITTRLSGMPVWTVADSREAAETNIRQTPGLLLDLPDYSVASDELQLTLPEDAQAGAVAVLRVPVRNVGVTSGGLVAVSLNRSERAGEDTELQRYYLGDVPLNRPAELEFRWSLEAGRQRYTVVIDPDGRIEEGSRSNNTAFLWVDTPGDETPPVLEILSPQAGEALEDSVVRVGVRATDNVRIARVDARIDGGLWAPLVWREDDLYETSALLQPGERVIHLRAIDGAGNQTEAQVAVLISAPRPELAFRPDSLVDETPERRLPIEVHYGEDTAALAVRVNSGPWQPMFKQEGSGSALLDLRFGQNEIEVKAINHRGVERIEKHSVNCLSNARPESPPHEGTTPPAEGSPIPGQPSPSEVDVAGFGPKPISTEGNRIRPPRKGETTSPPGSPPEPPTIPPLEVDPGSEGDAVDPEINVPGDTIRRFLALGEEGLDPNSVTTEVPAYDGFAPEGTEEEHPPMTGDEFWDQYRNMLLDFFANLAEQTDPDLLGEDMDNPGTGEFEGLPLPPSGLSYLPPPGRSIGVQHTQLTHHCTNRPNISMPFRMPDWLLALNLPEPGTKEYEDAIHEMLVRLLTEGIDTEPFERLHKLLRQRALRMEPGEELPGFLKSLVSPRALTITRGDIGQEIDSLNAWREGMAKKVDAFWLRLLASGDPELIYEGLKARANAFGRFEEGAMLAAHAAMDSVRAHQQSAQDLMQSLPFVGTAVDVLSLYNMETMAGERVTGGQIALMAGFRALTWLGPKALEKVYMRAMKSKDGRMFFAALREMGDNMTSGAFRTVAGLFGSTEENLKRALFKKYTAKDIYDRLFVRKIETARSNIPAFRTPAWYEWAGAMNNQRIDRERAIQFLDRMARTTDPDEFARLAVLLQRDKTAQILINTPNYTNAMRRRAENVRAYIGSQADMSTAADIMGLTPRGNGLQSVLDRNPALRAEDVVVRARTITRTPGAGDFRYGGDRDVWFEFVDRRTGRRLGDVHHNVSGPAYNRNLRNLTGYSAEDLDHAVTSRWHPDSYATGQRGRAAHAMAAQDIIDGRSAGQLRRAEDIADTSRFKPWENFERARATTDPFAQQRHMREGMRQAVKEYDRHIAPFLAERGIGVDQLPNRMREGLHLFRQVQEGVLDDSMTPENAVRILNTLGADPMTIVEDIAQYIRFINLP